jgi:hypothetical protein
MTRAIQAASSAVADQLHETVDRAPDAASAFGIGSVEASARRSLM